MRDSLDSEVDPQNAGGEISDMIRNLFPSVNRWVKHGSNSYLRVNSFRL